MTRIIKKPSLYAVTLLSLMLLLLTTAEGKAAAKTRTSKTNSTGLPFLQSEAEKWSFQNQIQKSASEYMKNVEANAKELMRTRYKFDRRVKIPDYFADLSAKAHSNGRLNGTVHFFDGWANGFLNISLSGETTTTYEDSTVKFQSEVKMWKNLGFAYEYIVLEDCREFKGKIKVDLKDVRYSLTTALDIQTKVMELKDFGRKSIGSRDVLLEAPEGNGRLSRILSPVFSGFYRDTVLPDVETFLRTVLEDSFANVSVGESLPKVDFEGQGRPEPLVEGSGLDICDTDAEEESDEDDLPWKSVTDLPFIQNAAEMWAFQRQMNNGLNQLMEQVSVRTTEHLAERELLRGKLVEDKFLMNIRDQTSTTRHGPMVLCDGWFSSPFKFGVSKVRQVEFREGAVDFTTSFHLEDAIEVVQDFKAVYLREDYEGKVKGSVKFLEYALKFSLDLETAALTLEDPKLDCVRDVSIAVAGLESEGDWFLSEVERNVLKRFRDSTLPQIHAVLSRAFSYAASAETAGKFLPKWSYGRDFRTDFGFRVGELDEDAVDICEEESVRKAVEREKRFSKLIGEDGVFNDTIPGADGKYFTHVSGVKNVGIRYTSTKTQSWYFGQDLRLKMNEYMYTLLNTTRELIRVRDLGKAKMPEHLEAAKGKFDKELRIEKGWIDGLTSAALTGVDLLEFDQKVITLMTNILVYKELKFEGEYQLIRSGGSRERGTIVTQLPPMEISLRIDIDYLGEKRAKLDYMKLECVGEKSSYSLPYKRIDRVSDSLEAHFRDVMVEQVFQIFRRAFEDAMATTKWEEFLPKWDYERDYISEIILQKNVNRFQINMEYCNSTEDDKITLKALYPGLKTLEFSQFLPEIKMPSLRRSFLRQINILMADAVNSMWRNMVKGPLQRFNPPKFHDKGIVLEPKDSKGVGHRISLIYSNTDFQGLTSGSYLDEVDFAYGEEDTLIILYKQVWDSLKVTYNLTISDDQDNEKEYGTAVAEAKDLQYLLKVRFFLSNSTLSVDEFFLRCLRNFSVTVRGLSPERQWMVDSIEDTVTDSFPESELGEIKELIFILYGYAAAELKMDLYTYSWTYDRDLYAIAAAQKSAQEAGKRSCKEERQAMSSVGSNQTLIARGHAPFIGSEAEWWSFTKRTKGQVGRYQREVKKLAREFLRDHALENLLIPDLSKNFARETNEESDTVICKLNEGITSSVMTLKYSGNTMVDVGKDMKITSFIGFNDDLKMRYQLVARSDKEVANGRVRGIVKSLIYKMVIRVNEEDKSAKLESFEFECMNDLEIAATLVKKNFKWMKDMIPEAFREDFASVVMGDIEKILKMAFEFGVKNVDVTPYVEDWNYKKDYGARSKPEEQKSTRDSSSCPSPTKE